MKVLRPLYVWLSLGRAFSMVQLPFIHHSFKSISIFGPLVVSAARGSAAFSPVVASLPQPINTDTTPFRVDTTSSHHHPCARSYSSQVSKMAILESPSAERNKQPIYEQVLSTQVFPHLVDDALKSDRDKIKVVELAAGCGVHTTHFVSSFLSSNKDLGIEWHPSDPDSEARSSTDAIVRRDKLDEHIVPSNSWILGKSGGTACGDKNRDRGDAGLSSSGNDGNVADYEQYHGYFDLALCINMIHISPWEATLGLMECAGKVLRKGGMLVCYGPYKVDGTAVESNLNFDRSLRSRNLEWGIRNLEDVIDVAKKEGLEFVKSVEMPANNLSVLFCKA